MATLLGMKESALYCLAYLHIKVFFSYKSHATLVKPSCTSISALPYIASNLACLDSVQGNLQLWILATIKLPQKAPIMLPNMSREAKACCG